MFIYPSNTQTTSRISVQNKAAAVGFSGATEIFKKEFIRTQKEISDIFVKDPNCDGIAGTLPTNWLARIQANTEEEKQEIIKKVLHAFRAAVKHLHPYNAPKKAFIQERADLENKRIKEASQYLTKSLRHFGILPEDGSVNFKKLKVHGNYMNRGYVLREKSKNPTLEKLFIKTFKHINPILVDADYNGKYAETAHWININEHNCKYFSKFYWGDIKGNFMASEYVVPPKYSSPIVRFKKSYETLQDFAKDFLKQTGIQITELISRGIRPGKTNHKGVFIPKDKVDLIREYLQSELDAAGLFHGDLHKDNAIIGTDENGKAIVKIIDIGGIIKR